jgi:hypothetical protein
VSQSAGSSPDVDLLAVLQPRAMLAVALGGLLGGLAGLGAGKALVRHHEARAVLRVATLGMVGPVMPLSEVKARAESRRGVLEALKAQGVPDEAGAAGFKVSTELDPSRDGTVVTVMASGPDAEKALGLARHVVDGLVKVTHDAYEAAMADGRARMQQGAEAAQQGAMQQGAMQQGAMQQGAAGAQFERWAGELQAARRAAEREVVTSRDTEVLDPPYLRESNARVLLVAALGALAGVLVALAFAGGRARAA